MTKEDIEKLKRLFRQASPIEINAEEMKVLPWRYPEMRTREEMQVEYIRRLAQNELEWELLRHAEELIRCAVLTWKMDQLGMSMGEEDQE